MPMLAQGRIAAANTPQMAWVAPPGSAPNFSINLCNIGDAIVYVSVAYQQEGAATAINMENKFPLDPAGTKGNTLERTNVLLSAGMQVWITCSEANAVDWQIYGYEA